MVGLNAAVIFQNIVFWVEKNQANRNNFREGRYWTYNSISAFGELFPYLSGKQIRTALEKLVASGLILKGNFNDDRYDRTCWYALGNSICPDGQIDPTKKEIDAFASEGHPSAPGGKSLRNRYKPYQNPDPSPAKSSAEDEVTERILVAYPEDRVRRKAVCISQIRKTLAEGVDAKDLASAVHAYATETAGFTRSKVCFSDNWFQSGRWRPYVEKARAEGELAKQRADTAVEGLAVWVREQHALCRTISSQQAAAMVERGLVTPEQLRAVGL
ncbi:hypothetical protein [Shimia sp. MMG029]|uniref:hypothetical protein n=1 Tax=Shimia sp. MMG029 TaxID=3021978 RepID=UPI0022FE17FA|nr:hypothetical protein [Shimia sp. MMG029]MDA5558699.1 hypothetical protein [Shimia sp. MMG029]